MTWEESVRWMYGGSLKCLCFFLLLNETGNVGVVQRCRVVIKYFLTIFVLITSVTLALHPSLFALSKLYYHSHYSQWNIPC